MSDARVIATGYRLKGSSINLTIMHEWDSMSVVLSFRRLRRCTQRFCVHQSVISGVIQRKVIQRKP
jgi:hypothetical protein